MDETQRPVSFQIWVSIIPIGGVKASWSDWQRLESGALIAGQRMLIDRFEVPVTDIRVGNHWSAIGLEEDPFAGLENW